MEIEDAAENLENPCTGKVEIVSIDYKPGLGFVQSYISGNIYAEVDPFVLIQCRDGRVMVKNAEEKKLICDTMRPSGQVLVTPASSPADPPGRRTSRPWRLPRARAATSGIPGRSGWRCPR